MKHSILLAALLALSLTACGKKEEAAPAPAEAPKVEAPAPAAPAADAAATTTTTTTDTAAPAADAADNLPRLPGRAYLLEGPRQTARVLRLAAAAGSQHHRRFRFP